MVLSHPVVIGPAPGVAPARPDLSVVPLSRAGSTRHVPIRSTEMHLLHEQLARAHSDDLSARAAAADRASGWSWPSRLSGRPSGPPCGRAA